MSTDAELLREYAGTRSEAAIAELVNRYLGLVYHAALRQLGGDTHGAQDVAQVVFTRLAGKAAALRRHEALAGWLHTTTRFAASEARRTEQRRLAREQEAHTMDEISRESGAVPDWERVRPVIDEALGELNDREREAVLLRYFAGRSYAEVGLKLHLSENAARMRVDRALEKLHAALARRGVRSTTAVLASVFAEHAVGAVPAGLAAAVTSAVLTASAGTGAGALGILMSTTKLTAGVAGLVVLLALGTATHEVLAQRRAEGALEAARQDQAAERARVAAVTKEAASAEREATALRPELDFARKARAAEEQRPARAAARRNGPDPAAVAAGEAFMARHPEVEHAVMDAYHAQTASTFGTLYRARAFTPAQIAAFEAAMEHGAGVQRMITGIDGKTFILSVPGWLDPEKSRQEDQQLLALLGADGAQQLRDTVQQIPARNLAAQVAGALSATPAPLTTAQADQLVQAVATSLPSRDRTGSTAIDWNTLIARAQPILTEPQLATLAGFQAQEQYQQALNAALLRANRARQTGQPGN
jgi:RNA polymerase sigma factor (sigma-70 family)